MSLPANPTPDIQDEEDLSLALQTIEQRAVSLDEAMPSSETIWDTLDQLFQQGSDANALQLIQDETTNILRMTESLDQSFRSAINIAQTLKEQRDAHLKKLEDITDAIKTVDTNVPEIEELVDGVREEAEQALTDLQIAIRRQDRRVPEIDDLVESVHDEAIEDAETYLADTMWEQVHDEIFQSTPLEFDEVDDLIDILTGGAMVQLPSDHDLWFDLVTWINSFKEAAAAYREGR